MKRFVVLFLTLFYLTAVCGIAWSNFYCCGKLKQTTFYNSADLSKKCNGSQKAGCCDYKHFFSKVKDNHSGTSTKVNIKDAGKIVKDLKGIRLYKLSLPAEQPFASADSPPLVNKQPVYLSVNNFRI